jgi:sterol desaturase/sphingolipid hydroxylase (fatty acid hydroxylase superfamily)
MKKSKESIRLFENPFLESLTKTNALFVIATLALISLSILLFGIIKIKLSILGYIVLFLSGTFVYTLAEYLIHRFIYHSAEYKNPKKWIFKIHGMHHTTPRDKQRLVLPLPVSITLAGLFIFVFWLIIGKYVFIFFPGFLMGYSYYLSLHYFIHTTKPPKNFFSYLWKHHLLHHYKNETVAFGLTFPLWDIIFGTMPKDKKLE